MPDGNPYPGWLVEALHDATNNVQCTMKVLDCLRRMGLKIVSGDVTEEMVSEGSHGVCGEIDCKCPSDDLAGVYDPKCYPGFKEGWRLAFDAAPFAPPMRPER